MLDDADAIRNLLFRYAELIDAGDFDGVGALFEHAEVDWGGDVTRGSTAVTARLESTTRRYEDGTPRTVHLVVNPIVELGGDGVRSGGPSDDAGGPGGGDAHRAAARSRYVVIQPVGEQVLAPIVFGRYEDRFERVDGRWRFAARRYLVDQLGDLSHHLPEALVALLRAPAASDGP